MAKAERMGGRGPHPWRIAGWGALAGLLLLPAVAMRFTTEVNWDETDFITMGVLLGSLGLGAEFLFQRSGSIAYRLGAALALLTGFLTIWVNLAVGMIGDGPYNLLFVGVLAVMLIGAAAGRFRPEGMARATLAAAGLQALLAIGGLPSDLRGGTLSLIFVLPWLLAAGLFRRAAREHA